MRATLAGLIWVGAVLGVVGGVDGGVAYHFMPGIEGQVRGFAQFAEVAPQYGPKDFKVRLSGAMVGADPRPSPTTVRVYLDKWGLGVLNPAAGKDVGIQGQVQVDGKRGGEYIRMEFAVPVRFTLLTFASVSAERTWRSWLTVFPSIGTDYFPAASRFGIFPVRRTSGRGPLISPRALQPTVFAKRWDVVVRGSAFGDGIQLENVEIEAVPEPSTLAVFVAGARGCRTLGGASSPVAGSPVRYLGGWARRTTLVTEMRFFRQPREGRRSIAQRAAGVPQATPPALGD